MRAVGRLLWLLVWTLMGLSAFSRSTCYYVQDIELEGARLTRLQFVMRVLGLRRGDTLCGNLEVLLQERRKRIVQLNLFKDVQLIPIVVGQQRIRLKVVVRERFYWYPVFVLDWADRNITEWIRRFRADPRRLIWGLALYRQHFRGRGELLKFLFASGALKKVEVVYDAPWLSEQWGFNLRLAHSWRH